jgi:hypothetical protein
MAAWYECVYIIKTVPRKSTSGYISEALFLKMQFLCNNVKNLVNFKRSMFKITKEGIFNFGWIYE